MQRTTLCANRVIRCIAVKYYSISSNSPHFHGTHVPVEEPSTASAADIHEMTYRNEKDHLAAAFLKSDPEWAPFNAANWLSPSSREKL
jgi:hypothetical protein